MKKLFFLLSVFFCLNCMAQTLSREEFLNKYKDSGKEISAAFKSKDYALIETVLSDWLADYGKLSEQNQADFKNWLNSTCYNLACTKSMLGDKEGAIEAFGKAVENGWWNYSHALKDKDLDNIRDDKRFLSFLQVAREHGDYTYILCNAVPFDHGDVSALPGFTYQDPGDPDLVRVRTYFNLDSIAGNGNEISRIMNLMQWVHSTVRHDGSSNNPSQKNAIDLVEICKKENRGINCRMMATLLNECYLAMGFKSRFVTCMPKYDDGDCHVINAVYSVSLDKWIWMDPSFNAYVSDENGSLLGIAEVRERIRQGKPVILNEDANWNGEKTTQEHYLGYYMVKNLYYLACYARSEFNSETKYEGKISSSYIGLLPSGTTPVNSFDLLTGNEEYFWQAPNF